MGTSSIVYVSISDTTTTCANLGLPTLPTGWGYNCVTQANLKKSDGTGWVPVNFSQITFGSPLSNLPIDPVNTTSSRNYYTYVSGGSWQIASKLESQKYQPQAASTNDYDPGLYVLGNNTNLAPFVGGLVGWWKFDDNNNSTTTDSSGYGNTGTWNGTSTSRYATGKVGSYAGSFNGGSDYVDLGSKSIFNMSGKKLTISAWINSNDSSGYKIIFGLVNGAYSAASYGLWLYADYYEFSVSNGIGGANVQFYPVGLNQWHNLVGVYDSNNLTYYVDGVQLAPVNWVGGNINPLTQLYIGRHSLAMGYFSGSIDDVRIYDRAFSAVEVSALYNATR